MFVRRSHQDADISVRVAELLPLIKSKSADTRIVYIALSINLVFSSTSTPLEDKESTFWISTSLEAKLAFSLSTLIATCIQGIYQEANSKSWKEKLLYWSDT